MSFEEALEHAAVQRMTVYDLLLMLPRIGRHRALEILRQSGVSERRTIAQIPTRQRELLVLSYKQLMFV